MKEKDTAAVVDVIEEVVSDATNTAIVSEKGESTAISVAAETNNSIPTTANDSTTPSSPETTSSPTSLAPEAYLPYVENSLKQVLTMLHLCAKYEHLSGKKLPLEVDFFGKSILGMTSILSFHDTIAQSTRMAGLYLDVSRIGYFNF